MPSTIVIPRDLISAATILAPFLSSATAGSILTLSYFSIPIIRSVSVDHSPARALDHVKALFSSGSHIYPTLSVVCTGLYGLLAYSSPAGTSARSGYSVAAAGTLGIAPFTVMVMLPLANHALLDLYDKREKRGAGAVEKDKEELDGLLRRFEGLNAVRAGIMGMGAVGGLCTALIL
ncbi:uncharacterized protein MKK02DRAFT_42480 [Dioszegia hungarica]|uniref:DUF1772-domain-containing protein n=1 Tax=Dioszegia hungarica TaxID=4972 RepID=A0AA38HBE5_9TREE|nr:uncharacterized protein MKK02DRAFT_42480 [Dioszegia hungarica]KAI9638093.1 hypothetical protein MKK02DRAFT_42480 [Dioszegia hungarica]